MTEEDKQSSNNNGPRVPEMLPVGIRLTDNKLNGSNFFEWSKTIRIYLRSMGMASHLKSDPPTGKDSDSWLQSDARLYLQIINTIEPSVSSLVTHCEYVKDLMEYLDILYSGQINISRINTVCKSFHRGEQQDRSLTNYVMEFKKVYEELNSLLPLSADVKAMQAQREQVAVISFLTGLRPEYESIRSQFLSESAIPSLQETFARVLRSESVQPSPNPEHNSALVSRGDSMVAPEGGLVEDIEGALEVATLAEQPSHMLLFPIPMLWNVTTVMSSVTPNEHLLARYPRSSSAHVASASDDTVTIPAEEYARLLGTEHSTAPTAAFAETSNSSTCLLSSASKWVIDSGASDHMTGNPTLFSTFDKHMSPSHVTIVDGSASSVLGSGTVELTPFVSLSYVLSLHKFSFNLLSVNRITRTLNCSVKFFPDFCVFKDLLTKKIIGRGREADGLYIFEHQPPRSLACSNSSSPLEVHCRLGHPSLQNLKKLCPEFSSLSSLQCESCQFSKHQRIHLSPRVCNKRASSPFELVHSDVWGPCPVTSKLGFKYFVTFVDDYSRTTWLYFMKNRSEVFTHFCSLNAEIKTQFKVSFKLFVVTMRKNICLKRFSHICFRMVFFMSLPVLTHHPKMELRNERTADDVATACFLINRMPSVILDGQSPFSVLFPTKSLFPIDPKIFGSTCFVCDTRPHITKLDPKSLKCVFLGYSRLQKGYRCFSPTLNRYIVSRDVTFHENVPFFPVSTSCSLGDSDDLLIYVTPLPESPSPSSDSTPSQEPPKPPIVHVYNRRQRPRSDPEPIPSSSSSIDLPTGDPLAFNSPPPSDTHDPNLDVRIALRKGKRSCTYPISSVVSYDKLSSRSRSLISTLDSISIPKTVGEALAHSRWRDVMLDEINALDHNGTWDLVELPAIGCKWVFTVKVNPDGSVARLKAWLVAKEYAQTYGVDYSETFSPVAKVPSIRLFISLAATYDWVLHQLDVKIAWRFTRGILYGATAWGESGRVCRLRKSFNPPVLGLDGLTEFGLRRSSYDHSVFFTSSSPGCILLVVYVDDIVITGSDKTGIIKLKDFLASRFQKKDLGPLKYFLGIEVSRTRKRICLSQRKYCLDVLNDSGMIETKPCEAPMIPNIKLNIEDGDLLEDPGKYRRIVGKLNYLTITRPDIAFPVSVVSQFMSSPRTPHWEAVRHILKNLKGAPGLGILYQNHGHHVIEGFTDADYDGDPTSRRSTTGYCVFVGRNLVSWKSKKQNVVSRSSAESEYRAMAQTTCELIWLRNLLGELGFAQSKPMNLYCDNEVAIHIANNPVFHERTKHIEVDCHFTREKLEDGTISTPFVRTGSQLVVVFTKALPVSRVSSICNKLGMFNIYAPA
ncbi:LOW QUALITY PROTEIN: hypothetical protein OSB04_000821 [Centaurea solstitialis]|uniref:Uncharacterized protein n=1 Tax=Centaurea solstitialis TaxID=347529 RepID=A0AA38TPU2_9ASTR|nr:LOW QUALITY PROTEIN: hypothetical protein OSB04_000821 [Centaurea solstitialis]